MTLGQHLEGFVRDFAVGVRPNALLGYPNGHSWGTMEICLSQQTDVAD